MEELGALEDIIKKKKTKTTTLSLLPLFPASKRHSYGSISPTVANVFMSVTFHHFLATQVRKPLLLVRYIDNIFMIWTYEEIHLSFSRTSTTSVHSQVYTSPLTPNCRFSWPYNLQECTLLFYKLVGHKNLPKSSQSLPISPLFF